jgi:propanediol dehydratase small subunit
MTPENRSRLEALYPIGEKRPETIRSRSGRRLDEITLAHVLDGSLEIDDLGISADGLRAQADIARLAGRETLARNFERAAELVAVPNDLVLEVYELLRPGRTADEQPLREMAARLRGEYGAARIAALIEEAAAVYRRRGLFRKRY